MLAFLITLRIGADKADQFEADFAEMAAYVRDNEPDTLAYHLGRVEGATNTYRLIELYSDEDAVARHGGSEAFLAFKPKFGAALSGAPEVEKVKLLI